jgi:hypothetical protein
VYVGGGNKRNKVPEELKGCPRQRRPDESGNCSSKYPFKRKNEETGKQCCYKKPTKEKGLLKTSNGKVYIDGKQVNTLTYNQLSKAAKSFGKSLLPQMRRKNIIRILKQ